MRLVKLTVFFSGLLLVLTMVTGTFPAYSKVSRLDMLHQRLDGTYGNALNMAQENPDQFWKYIQLARSLEPSLMLAQSSESVPDKEVLSDILSPEPVKKKLTPQVQPVKLVPTG